MSAFKRLLALFRGSDSGQSVVEYLTLVGACALVGIAGFTRYGQAVKADLGANARHIEGDGLPNTEGILGSLGADYNEIPGWCVKPNYCFAAGTPVQTAHGDRAIESIRVGESVWARDVTTGAIALRSVVNTYRTARVPVVELELSVGRVRSEHLAVTRSHLFWVEGSGWVRADALGAGPLWSIDGATAARLTPPLLGGDSELTTVYNLEVAEFHSYFVGHSHVLVHNGNASNDGCPETTPAPVSTRPPRTWGPKIECGDTGSYYEQLGGWDKDNSRMRMSRPSNGLERDHIPSTAALKTRAAQLLDELAARMADSRCRELTEDEQKALTTARTQAGKQLATEATYDGFAVAEPPELHAEGRTYRKKNTREQYEHDAHDLALAAQKDARALEDAIKAGVVDDLECVQAMWGVLQSIGGKTQEDYDHELGGLAQSQLESSGFNQIIRDTCVGHDLQTESQRH